MNLLTPREHAGSISLRDKAIAEIAGLAALEVPGVVALKGNWLEQLVEWIWKPLPHTGIRIQLNDRDISIALSVAVKYGENLGEVAAQVQDKVREMVEKMTGHTVGDIQVSIVQVQPVA